MNILLSVRRVKTYWILMPQDVKNQHLTQGVHHIWMEAPLLTQNGCWAGWERRAVENMQGWVTPANLCTFAGQQTDRLKTTTSARVRFHTTKCICRKWSSLASNAHPLLHTHNSSEQAEPWWESSLIFVLITVPGFLCCFKPEQSL